MERKILLMAAFAAFVIFAVFPASPARAYEFYVPQELLGPDMEAIQQYLGQYGLTVLKSKAGPYMPQTETVDFLIMDSSSRCETFQVGNVIVGEKVNVTVGNEPVTADCTPFTELFKPRVVNPGATGAH